MRRQKACVIWHPVNPRALISTHTEVSGLQKSNWRWQPPPRHWDLGWVLHGSLLWNISLGTIQAMAVTEPSPRSQSLCFGLEGGLGGHGCQF